MQNSAGTVQTSGCNPPELPSDMRLPRGSPYQSAKWPAGGPPSSGVPTITANSIVLDKLSSLECTHDARWPNLLFTCMDLFEDVAEMEKNVQNDRLMFRYDNCQE